MTNQSSAVPTLDASIIVCTYNRADSLEKTLTCLTNQKIPDNIRWEVIVVDNNSKDHTKQVVENAIPSFSSVPLRYEFEEQQGLSHARNRGIQCTSGDIILFTDDDVCPESDWLEKTLNGMTQYQCAACGGYIAPSWENEPPNWLTSRFHGFLAIRTDLDGPRQITEISDVPFGANMAFRRSIINNVGMFDTSRGRKGAELASGEDGEMFARILQSNSTVMYFPESRVHHRIETFRTKKRYFRRWRYQTSRNIAISRGIDGKRRIQGVPLYLLPQLLRAMGRAFISRFRDSADEAFYNEIIVWHFFGLIDGLSTRHKQTIQQA